MSVQVYLVPGFFGFASLGSLNYFQRVAEVLEAALAERGIDAQIHEVATQPTSSLRRRAVALCDDVEAQGGMEADQLHFVGHSTGGLDIRLLLTPGVALLGDGREDHIAARTRSAISIATPHFGTPLATTFTGLQGRNLLYLLAALAGSGPGRWAVWLGARVLDRIARLDDLLGQRDTVLDLMADRVLGDVRARGDGPVNAFVRSIASDQGAMVQLTPEAIDLFNAAVHDRAGVEYVSFVTGAPRPPSRGRSGDIYSWATHLVYALSHTLAAREHRHYPYPSQAQVWCDEVAEQLGMEVDSRTNDGVVPTLSQLWGRFGGAVRADHLDVVGQFPHQVDGQRYPGWLRSGASFDTPTFEQLWQRIASEIAAASRRRRSRSESLELVGGSPTARGRSRPTTS